MTDLGTVTRRSVGLKLVGGQLSLFGQHKGYNSKSQKITMLIRVII